jgi:hypothetical protein
MHTPECLPPIQIFQGHDEVVGIRFDMSCEPTPKQGAILSLKVMVIGEHISSMDLVERCGKRGNPSLEIPNVISLLHPDAAGHGAIFCLDWHWF